MQIFLLYKKVNAHLTTEVTMNITFVKRDSAVNYLTIQRIITLRLTRIIHYSSSPIITERGQTGKGANLTLFGGAFSALCSARTNRGRLSLPASFSLVRFSWRSKRNEH